MTFREERGIGYCGLACALCGYDDGCPGCKARIAAGHDCAAGKCAVEMKVPGCYACPDFSTCEEGMSHGKRSRAFNRYAREFGEQALLDRLRVNFESGITYHTPDKSPGDYDRCDTEEEIYQLLRYGRNDPYTKYPEFDTEYFHLRLVREDDAEELLASFHNDVSGWTFPDNFTSPHPTLEEMKKHIRQCWLAAYAEKYFIRFTVINKASGKIVGTIEMFDNAGEGQAYLHIDLTAKYETREHISDLLALADESFFRLFDFARLTVRARSGAKERIAALEASGYELDESDVGENYYTKKVPA